MYSDEDMKLMETKYECGRLLSERKSYTARYENMDDKLGMDKGVRVEGWLS
jgi:hypothetical protein